MKKILLLICINFTVFVFLGVLWYYPIMPFLFYNTLADSEMKQQMDEDLIEFYRIVNETHELSRKGVPLTVPEKVVLFFTPGGEYGFLLWPIVGILLGLWRGIFSHIRLRKQVPATPIL